MSRRNNDPNRGNRSVPLSWFSAADALGLNDDGPTTPTEREQVDEWLRRNRCCGSPSACGAVCYDDEESHTLALVVREMDRLRGGVA